MPVLLQCAGISNEQVVYMIISGLTEPVWAGYVPIWLGRATQGEAFEQTCPLCGL